MRTTAHRYIVTEEHILGGEPIVVGTRTPVRACVELGRQGLAPEAIPAHLPHLTLAQVFDALSYYSDHQDQINAYIERNHIHDDKGPETWVRVDAIYSRLAADGRTFSDSADLLREDRDR